MLPHSDTLAELIEPALYALRNPKGAVVAPVAAQARAARLRARSQIQNAGEEVHMPSFELGVASTFTELLAVTEQRSVINDATQAVKSIAQGLETLHQIAVINRTATVANQRELAEQIGADPGNFNRRIRRLVEQGLIESERRGQAMLYTLTPLGLDVLTLLKPGWRAIHPDTHAPVTTEVEALEAARQVMERIASNMMSGIERVPSERLAEAVYVAWNFQTTSNTRRIGERAKPAPIAGSMRFDDVIAPVLLEGVPEDFNVLSVATLQISALE